MKKFLVYIVCLISTSSLGQSHLNCGIEKLKNNHSPRLEELLKNKSRNNILSGGNIIRIPVVFHILHQNGPENISDAQIMDALRILNEDFRKTNTDISQVIPEFQDIAADTEIEFVLPTKDPQGNCTNGIIHYLDPDADWNIDSPTLYQYTWDPTSYMNVYVVKTIDIGGFPAAGYTYLPGSLSDGDIADAIVLLNNYLGSIGTSNYFKARVLTHEVGHWLGLYHTFGASNGAAVDCNNDDFIDDTPQTQGFLICPDANNPSSYQICSPGVSENYQNYMDYSYCCKMFTNGQKDLMINVLNSSISGRNNLWSSSNLLQTGVLNPIPNCVPIANFYQSRIKTCTGVPVQYFAAPYNDTATTFNWIFPGGIPSSSTDENPMVIYNNPGSYNVTFSCGNIAGNSQPITINPAIEVIASNQFNFDQNYSEEFDVFNNTFNFWSNGSNSGSTQFSIFSGAGYFSESSLFLDRLGNTRYNKTWSISPRIQLNPSFTYNYSLYFAGTEAFENRQNKFRLYYSKDCEQTWILLHELEGNELITANDNSTEFLPVLPSDWNQLTGLIEPDPNNSIVVFKIEYERDSLSQPRNFYVDNFNISNADMVQEQIHNFTIYPNPSSNQITIFSSNLNFDNVSIFNITGQLIIDKKINKAVSDIDISEISNGTYILRLHDENSGKYYYKKLMKNQN